MLRGLGGDADQVSDAAFASGAGGSEEGHEVGDEERAGVAPAVNGRGSGGDACDEEDLLDQSVVPPPHPLDREEKQPEAHKRMEDLKKKATRYRWCIQCHAVKERTHFHTSPLCRPQVFSKTENNEFRAKLVKQWMEAVEGGEEMRAVQVRQQQQAS